MKKGYSSVKYAWMPFIGLFLCSSFEPYWPCINAVLLTLFEKSNFLSKNSILTKPPTFWRVFHPNFFLTIFVFLVKSKLSTAKKPKTTTFSRAFHPKKIDNFLGKSKLNFWTKNEDFEQCASQKKISHTVTISEIISLLGFLLFSFFFCYRQLSNLEPKGNGI